MAQKLTDTGCVPKNAMRIDIMGAMMSMKDYDEHKDLFDYIGGKLINLADDYYEKTSGRTGDEPSWNLIEIATIGSLLARDASEDSFWWRVEFLGVMYEAFLDYALDPGQLDILSEKHRRDYLVLEFDGIMESIIVYISALHFNEHSGLRADFEEYRKEILRPYFNKIFPL